MKPMSEPRARSGPVRSEAARLAILETTARLFTEHGYDSLTIEGIAAEAGVGKQTIYRWWHSKSGVVAESLIEGLILPEQLAIPNTGDIRRDLIEWVGFIFEALSKADGGGMLRSLVAAATENPEIGDRLRRVLSGPDSLTGRLTKAAGSVPHLPDASAAAPLSEALIGWVILRVLGSNEATPEEAARVIDALLGTGRGSGKHSG